MSEIPPTNSIYQEIQNGKYNLPTDTPKKTIQTLNKVKEIAIQEIQRAFDGETGGESKNKSPQQEAKELHDKAAQVLEKIDAYIKQLRESDEAKGMKCLVVSKKCDEGEQPQPESKKTEDGEKSFRCPNCRAEISFPKTVDKHKPLFRCGNCNKIWETRFSSKRRGAESKPIGVLTHGEDVPKYYPIFKNSTPNTGYKEDDPPNPSRIPKLRKPIKKNITQKKNVKSLVETLRCSVDDKGELQCDDPLKVSKWTYHGKPVNRINYGDNKNKDTNKSPVAPEIPDNPFKKASDENWLENKVLNHPDYLKTKEKFDIYLAFLNNSNYFDNSNDIEKWIDTLPNNIDKFPNSLKEKLINKKNSLRYFTILKKCLNQLNLDVPRSIGNSLQRQNINEIDNLIKQSANKLKLNNKITEKHPRAPNINEMTYHCTFAVLCIIFLEESINAFRYVQGQDRLFFHIFIFTKTIIAENSMKADEFIYIYYFLLKNIVFGKYPIVKPITENMIQENMIQENQNTGISFFNILFFQPKHFTYENTVTISCNEEKKQKSNNKRPWLKYKDNEYYDRTKESLVFNIFVSIILKKHRDIFSNMLISSNNVSKYMFHFFKEAIGLYIGDTGIGGENLTQNYKKSNIVNPGIMGNTDLNIVKNIYGNFLKTHNLLALLTSFFISYTSQLEQKFTFNNLPFVDEMEYAIKHPKIYIGEIFTDGKENEQTKPSPANIFDQKKLYKNELALTHFGFRLWTLFSGGSTFFANYQQEQILGGNNNFFYEFKKLKQYWKNISIASKDNINIKEDLLIWDGNGCRPAGDRNVGDVVKLKNEEPEKKGWIWTIMKVNVRNGVTIYNISGIDPKPGKTLIGRQNPEHWSYTEDAINDYNVIINFINSNKFDELLDFFYREMPHWYSIPKLPVDFILYDNSMWNIPYEETWQKSNAILIDGIPPRNALSEISDTKDDNDDDNDSCGDIKTLNDSCPKMGDWVTKLCDPQKIQQTIDALEKCIEKYKKYDSTGSKEKVRVSEAQLRYLKKKLVLMQIEEGKNPFELSESDRQRIDNMTGEEKDASSKEIELLFGPHPLSSCDESKECKFTPEEEKEFATLEKEVDAEDEAKEDETLTPEEEKEFAALEAEVDAEAEAEAEAIPPVLAQRITKMKTLIKRQKKELREGKTKTRKYIRMSNDRKKNNSTRKRHKIFAGSLNRRNKQLEKIIINNVKVLKLLKKTARDIVEAKKANATTSIENPVFEGGGKLSRGQLADYRLKHIQKLLNKQKKNKTLKKFNRRLNKTIKLY